MTAIFNQFFGIGDILFIEPIMRRYFQAGYKVVLPVLDKYYDHRIHFPYVEFVKVDDLKIDYECKDVVSNGDQIVFPVRWSREFFNSPLYDTMRNKYRMFDLELNEWRTLTWLMFKDKEAELCKLLNLPEKFNLINTNYHSFQDGKREIIIDNGLPNVNMSFIQGFTLLDWAGVIQRATTIHSVNTSILYLIETLPTTKDLHLYSRNVNGKDFRQTEYLRSKNYQLHS